LFIWTGKHHIDPNTDSVCTLMNLLNLVPNDVWRLICACLSLDSLKNLSCTCKILSKICTAAICSHVSNVREQLKHFRAAFRWRNCQFPCMLPSGNVVALFYNKELKKDEQFRLLLVHPRAWLIRDYGSAISIDKTVFSYLSGFAVSKQGIYLFLCYCHVLRVDPASGNVIGKTLLQKPSAEAVMNDDIRTQLAVDSMDRLLVPWWCTTLVGLYDFCSGQLVACIDTSVVANPTSDKHNQPSFLAVHSVTGDYLISLSHSVAVFAAADRSLRMVIQMPTETIAMSVGSDLHSRLFIACYKSKRAENPMLKVYRAPDYQEIASQVIPIQSEYKQPTDILISPLSGAIYVNFCSFEDAHPLILFPAV